MCGRTELNTDWTELAAALGIPLDLSATVDRPLPALNVPPTATVPVAVGDSGARTLKTMRWGFPAMWIPKPWSRPRFNARSEYAAMRGGVWSSALSSRRCLMPVTAFYEWVPRSGGGSVPLRFAPAGGGVMTLAGVWETFERDGALVDCVSVLTCAANAEVAQAHDRMPVILSEPDWDRWLDVREPASAVHAMMRPWSSSLSVSEAFLTRAA